MEVWDPVKIYGSGIIFWVYSGLDQDILVFFQIKLFKVITILMCRDNTESRLIIDSRKLVFRIIVVNRVPEYLAHRLSNVKGGAGVNFMRRVAAIGITRQTILYYNPKKKYIKSYISGRKVMVNDGVCALTIYLHL